MSAKWRRESVGLWFAELPAATAKVKRQHKEGHMDVGGLHYACLYMWSPAAQVLKTQQVQASGSYFIFLFIYSLPQQPHNLPCLSPSSTLPYANSFALPPSTTLMLCTPRSHCKHLKDFDTAQLLNKLLLGCGQVFLHPKTPIFSCFPVRFNKLCPWAVGHWVGDDLCGSHLNTDGHFWELDLLVRSQSCLILPTNKWCRTGPGAQPLLPLLPLHPRLRNTSWTSMRIHLTYLHPCTPTPYELPPSPTASFLCPKPAPCPHPAVTHLPALPHPHTALQLRTWHW